MVEPIRITSKRQLLNELGIAPVSFLTNCNRMLKEILHSMGKHFILINLSFKGTIETKAGKYLSKWNSYCFKRHSFTNESEQVGGDRASVSSFGTDESWESSSD